MAASNAPGQEVAYPNGTSVSPLNRLVAKNRYPKCTLPATPASRNAPMSEPPPIAIIKRLYAVPDVPKTSDARRGNAAS
jgi:hypothetical protein